MIIAGMQKLTLVDYPKTVACTLFTQGCNLKCPFCHNPSLIVGKCENPIDKNALADFLTKRKGLIDGVCISGGEPLMQESIIDFLGYIKSFGYKIKLDTNGCFPEKLREVIKSGLADYIAMDIKSSKENYSLAAGKEVDLTAICQSVELLMSSGMDYEFRTTAVKGIHTNEDFESMADWIKGAKNYYIQQFVNSDELISKGLTPFTKEEMTSLLDIVKKQIPNAWLRGI